MLVSVCMCTYKRTHLAKTLDSVANLILLPNVEVEVVVVDNDKLKSGFAIVNNLQTNYPHTLIYCHEPKKNISAARNAYLREAKGEWVASLDDDEVADKYWLQYLLNAANEFNADVVFGVVKTIYPKGTPQWIIDGGLLARKWKATGTQVSSGATNCTLIKGSILAETDYNFDLSFGLTGGEDSQFFYRLHLKGFKLIVCKEAFVTELVQQNRLNSKYIIKRAFQIGQTYSRYRYTADVSFVRKLLFVIITILKLNFHIFHAILALPFSKKVWFKPLTKALDSLGKISFFCRKFKVELYKE